MAKKTGLSQEEFNQRMARLERRLELLRKVRDGKSRLKAVWVKPYAVRAYDVAGHYRYVEER